MSLFISSLSSGSNGNCYYVGNARDAVLVDAGISCREIEKRLIRNGLSIGNVKAIFISHEHTDHIFGLRVLAKKHQLPVYITAATLRYSGVALDDHLVKHFTPHSPITIGGLNITGFPKFHDAGDPHSFIIEQEGVTVGVFTDIGKACEQVTRYFSLCNAAFLESNYDEQMLDSGGYPFFLKRRITGGLGHLSNTLAVELFKSFRHTCLSHLILSHLSKNNNCPALVERLFSDCCGKTKIIVAPRYAETAVYEIVNDGVETFPAKKFVSLPKFKPRIQSQQLSMF